MRNRCHFDPEPEILKPLPLWPKFRWIRSRKYIGDATVIIMLHAFQRGIQRFGFHSNKQIKLAIYEGTVVFVSSDKQFFQVKNGPMRFSCKWEIPGKQINVLTTLIDVKGE